MKFEPIWCPICGSDNEPNDVFTKTRRPETHKQKIVHDYLIETNCECCCRLCFEKIIRCSEVVTIYKGNLIDKKTE